MVDFLFLLKWRLKDRWRLFTGGFPRSAGVSQVVSLSLVWLVGRHRRESAEREETGWSREVKEKSKIAKIHFFFTGVFVSNCRFLFKSTLSEFFLFSSLESISRSSSGGRDVTLRFCLSSMSFWFLHELLGVFGLDSCWRRKEGGRRGEAVSENSEDSESHGWRRRRRWMKRRRRRSK